MVGIFMYWTCNSMKNNLSYCGLVDGSISASEKDLPVNQGLNLDFYMESWKNHVGISNEKCD